MASSQFRHELRRHEPAARSRRPFRENDPGRRFQRDVRFSAGLSESLSGRSTVKRPRARPAAHSSQHTSAKGVCTRPPHQTRAHATPLSVCGGAKTGVPANPSIRSVAPPRPSPSTKGDGCAYPGPPRVCARRRPTGLATAASYQRSRRPSGGETERCRRDDRWLTALRSRDDLRRERNRDGSEGRARVVPRSMPAAQARRLDRTTLEPGYAKAKPSERFRSV